MQLHKTTIDDMFTSHGVIRADGLMEHEMYVMQVKTPEESKGPWDFYKLVQTMPGEQAFGTAEPGLPAGEEVRTTAAAEKDAPGAPGASGEARLVFFRRRSVGDKRYWLQAFCKFFQAFSKLLANFRGFFASFSKFSFGGFGEFQRVRGKKFGDRAFRVSPNFFAPARLEFSP